jgi:hypothetical protein
MSAVNVIASKLRKVFVESEAVAGTYEPLSTSSFAVPTIQTTTPVPSRGSRLIDRTNTMDGNAGDIISVPGTYGWSYSLESELQVPALAGPNYATIGYWGQILLGCGFEVDDGTDGTGDYYEYTLSSQPMSNYVAATFPQAPSPFSLTCVQNNNADSDFAMRLRGCTGVASFNLAVGEIATISAEIKGLIVDQADDSDNILDTSDIDISLLGPNYALNRPLVTKGITLSFTNNITTNPLLVQALQSLEINMNSENPDLLDPTEQDGLAISPVFHNTSPTISFTFPSTSSVDDQVFAALYSGVNFEIVVEVEGASAGSRFIRFTLGRVEFNEVTFGDTNTMTTYSVTGKVVRAPGETAATLMNIRYYHTLA